MAHSSTLEEQLADLLPVAELVRLLPSSRPGCRIAAQTVHRWLRSGKITGRKIGSRWYVSRAGVERLLADNQVAPENGG